MDFDLAVHVVLMHEGNYSLDPRDFGGETRFGISKRAFPNEDILNMTIVRAKEIYRKYYWDMCECESLPSWARLLVFDCAVNQGVTRAIILLQRTLKVEADGIIGNVTLQTAQALDPADFIYEYSKFRLNSYISNPQWVVYGKGWVKRLFDITSTSFRLLTRAPSVPVS